jgi:trehalose-phosphatase
MSRPLLTHLDEIGQRLSRASSCLLCLDFDGTLAPIIDDPAQVELPEDVRIVLRALVRKEQLTVALISGRARDDLQQRVNFPGLIYAGNHGLEISGPGFLFFEPTSVECRNGLQALAKDLGARLSGIDGAWVEDKGLTLSVHYRRVRAEAHDDVRRVVHGALAAASHPFVLTAANRVFEIRPRANWNKGNAVLWIKTQLDKEDALVIYLGDDATDEDAFATLADGVTVKVGNGAPTVAQYSLKGQERVAEFLDWVAHQVR